MISEQYDRGDADTGKPRQQNRDGAYAPGWQVDLVRLRRPVRRLDVAILRQTPDMRRDVFSLTARSGYVDPAVYSG
jgi:hypothetical protein